MRSCSRGPPGSARPRCGSAGVGEAASRGYRVLDSRGAESEARLSYAALGDLLGEAPEYRCSRACRPRSAMPSPCGPAPSRGGSAAWSIRRAVSLAAAYALRNLAADAPLVIAIDDLQWIDGPSARVLSFVLRRVADERVGMLVSIRQGSGSQGHPVDLERALTGPPTSASARCPSTARTDPSRANEPPTPPPRRGPASPHHRRQPAVRNRDGPGSFQRWPPGGPRRRLGGAGGPAAAPLREACRVASRGARAVARHRRDVPADLGAGARDRRIERANARIPVQGRGRRRHRAGEWPGAVLAPLAGVDRLRESPASERRALHVGSRP